MHRCRCFDLNDRFANGAEQTVWELLRTQIRDADVLMSGLRVTDHAKNHEADVVFLMPGAGVVIVEVKGRQRVARRHALVATPRRQGRRHRPGWTSAAD